MSNPGIKNFSLKFIDIMIGIVLGLGFQWWPELKEPWQHLAFIFAYISIIDYWIDYSPMLRKYPPHHELELMIDMGILFSLFLFIYGAHLSLIYFLSAFILSRVLDILWLWRIKREFVLGSDNRFTNTWICFDMVEILASAILIFLSFKNSYSSLTVLIIFIAMRLVTRIAASFIYRKAHFT